jgi:hypothetical protein
MADALADSGATAGFAIGEGFLKGLADDRGFGDAALAGCDGELRGEGGGEFCGDGYHE